MKIVLAITICLSFALLINAQETKHSHILSTPNWESEFFDFPIRFASDIPYKGYEEAVFPKGWAKEDSPEFWSYAFAWKIETKKVLTSQDFETQLQYYFDGLMDVKNLKNGTTILPTRATFKNTNSSNGGHQFTGSIYFYEGRYTKKMMTLYSGADIYYCEEKNKIIIIFKFSPKFYDQDIWSILNTINVRNRICD